MALWSIIPPCSLAPVHFHFSNNPFYIEGGAPAVVCSNAEQFSVVIFVECKASKVFFRLSKYPTCSVKFNPLMSSFKKVALQ